MKTFILLLCACASNIYAQSDCGNCWTISGGCDPTAICDFTGLCQTCVYYVDCDDHSCANGPHWQCVCPWSETKAAENRTCLPITREKGIVAKQKEKNAAQLKKVAWYRWSPIWNNAKH